MADFIRREDALKALYNDYAYAAMDVIKRLPAADVAEVVRCKDCELWDSDPDTYGKDTGPEGKCMKSFERMPADGFCSYGERREE